MSFTPGPAPWRSDHEWILDNDGDTVCKLTDRDGRPLEWPWLYDFAPPESYCKAEDNAALIAAAPELLEACKAALDIIGYWNDGDPEPWYVDDLRAAIAKAEGRTL